jgi:diaminopimelate epimerase
VDGVAPSVVVVDREALMSTRFGRQFYKLTGSGNDFVFVDARAGGAGGLAEPRVIQAVCARGTGVGADGVVFIDPPAAAGHRFAIRYFNRDGSLASLCGNASLCSVRLAVELEIAREGEDFSFGTGAGAVNGRLTATGPEIDLQPVTQLRPDAGFAMIDGERRIGFATVGVPHVVVLCDDAGAVDVVGRGRPIRLDPSLEAGANVNFVSHAVDGWTMRTYERGVEAETLACGTGAVATAALLECWGEAGAMTVLRTRSGLPLQVRFRERAPGVRVPSLSGEGRVVFRGELPATA